MEIHVSSHLMATRGWKTQRNFEAVVDEPLKGGQGANLTFISKSSLDERELIREYGP